MKVCTRCKEEKPLERFYRSEKSKDGHQSICKICANDNVYLSKGYTLVDGFWQKDGRTHRRFLDDFAE